MISAELRRKKISHPNLIKRTNPIPTPEVHGVVAKKWGHRFGMERFSHVKYIRMIHLLGDQNGTIVIYPPAKKAAYARQET